MYGARCAQLCVLLGPAGANKKGVSTTAMRILKEMKTNGVPTNTDSYNMVLEAMSLDGDLEGATALLKEMRTSPSCQPNLFSFLTLATFTCREGRPREALAYLEEAVAVGAKQRDPLAIVWRRYSYYISMWPRILRSLSWTVAQLSVDPKLPRLGPIFQVLAQALPPDVVNLPAIAQGLSQAGMGIDDIDRVTGVRMEDVLPLKRSVTLPDAWLKELGDSSRSRSSKLEDRPLVDTGEEERV